MIERSKSESLHDVSIAIIDDTFTYFSEDFWEKLSLDNLFKILKSVHFYIFIFLHQSGLLCSIRGRRNKEKNE